MEDGANRYAERFLAGVAVVAGSPAAIATAPIADTMKVDSGWNDSSKDKLPPKTTPRFTEQSGLLWFCIPIPGTSIIILISI